MKVSITTRYATEVIIKQKKGKQAVTHTVRVYRLQPTPKLFAWIVTGGGIRSLKRQRNKRLGQLAKKHCRCKKYSRRWKKLHHAKNKVCKRSLRRVRDARHKAIRQVIDFCTSSVVESAAQPLLARSAEPPNKK